MRVAGPSERRSRNGNTDRRLLPLQLLAGLAGSAALSPLLGWLIAQSHPRLHTLFSQPVPCMSVRRGRQPPWSGWSGWHAPPTVPALPTCLLMRRWVRTAAEKCCGMIVCSSIRCCGGGLDGPLYVHLMALLLAVIAALLHHR